MKLIQAFIIMTIITLGEKGYWEWMKLKSLIIQTFRKQKYLSNDKCSKTWKVKLCKQEMLWLLQHVWVSGFKCVFSPWTNIADSFDQSDLIWRFLQNSQMLFQKQIFVLSLFIFLWNQNAWI